MSTNRPSITPSRRPIRTRIASLAAISFATIAVAAGAGSPVAAEPKGKPQPPTPVVETAPASEEGLPMLGADATPADVAASIQANGGTDVIVHEIVPGEPSAPTGDFTTLAVPNDSFTVSSMWADYLENGKKHTVFYGFWNFRDDYVGGSDPNDASAAALEGFPASCFTMVSDSVQAKDYLGNASGQGHRYSSGQAKSIYGINDRVSGFMMITDNGIHMIDMRKDGGTGCDRRKAGSYFYEHNQGGSGWSAGVSVDALSLSYSGAGASSLQKAAKYNYYN